MNQQLPFIRLSLLDASDSTAGVQSCIRSGSTVADGEGALITFTDVIGALSDASIVYRYLIYCGVEDPQPAPPGAAPAAGAGVFVFSCEEPDAYAMVEVPGIRSDLLLSAGPGAGVLIDTTASDVVSFVNTLITGIFCNPFGVQLAALESAFYQWRP